MSNGLDLNSKGKTVGIVMGSISDFNIMKDAIDMLEKFGIEYEVNIVSAHRTPKDLFNYAEKAVERGLKVIIAGAGGAAHLPGMVASMTVLPVIGVPVKTKSLDGMDSLLSIVQMPKGVPVATVAINGAANAGILAAQIVGTNNSDISKKIMDYKLEMEEMVIESRKEIK
ncbi:MAG: 5-(carboxyamino)imidazole ribonucleotide mutase [Clostridium sp.]